NGTDELRLRLGEGSDQLLDGSLEEPHQLSKCLFLRREAGDLVEILRGQYLPTEGDEGRNELLVPLREGLHHAHRGAWIVLREREHERSLQLRPDDFERRADESLARERVLDDTHVHALASRLGTQLGHLTDRDAAVFGSDDGLGFRRNRAHFRYQRLFVF